MRDDTKAWTSVAADSESSDLRIRRSCQSLKNPAAQTLLTCLSRPRSDEMVTPRTRTCSLGVMVSSPRHRLGPQPSSSDRLCFVPVHNNSVLSALSFNRLADIQSQTSVMQCSSRAAAEAVSQRSQLCCGLAV